MEEGNLPFSEEVTFCFRDSVSPICVEVKLAKLERPSSNDANEQGELR